MDAIMKGLQVQNLDKNCASRAVTPSLAPRGSTDMEVWCERPGQALFHQHLERGITEAGSRALLACTTVF